MIEVNYRKGENVDNQHIQEVLQTEKTPLYVFNIAELERRIAYLKRQLPSRVELCYAIKANTFIVDAINDWIDQFEICSPGEYRICKNLHIPYEKYVISGVNKDPHLIEDILSQDEDVAYFTVESVHQFELLHQAAQQRKRTISLLLRLTSGNQFGLDRSDLLKLVEMYQHDPWVRIDGIQYFSGTQKGSLKKIKRELNELDRLLEELEDSFQFTVTKLEYGPGFPVTYFEGEEFDEDQFLHEFSVLLEEMKYKGSVALELGRSIAASCGTYLTTVVDTKQNHSERYAIVDGGMHQIVYYGQFMAMKHPVMRLFPERKQTQPVEWTICGSLCTINDLLVKKVALENLQMGDILVFEKTGAYCMTEGISLFLSRELPSIVLMDEKGNYQSVRPHIETDQFNFPQL